MNTEEEKHLLADFNKQFVPVEKWKRFLNWLIDGILFFMLFTGIGIYLTTLNSFVDEFAEDNMFIISAYFSYSVYISIIEIITNGKSIGKFFTKTVTLKVDGNKI